MNPFTLKKLEYEKIIDLLAAQCSSGLGKLLAEGLQPITDGQQIAYWQQETTEGVLVRRMEPNIPLGGLVDLNRQIRKAQIGGMLEPGGIFTVVGCISCLPPYFSLFFGTKKNL